MEEKDINTEEKNEIVNEEKKSENSKEKNESAAVCDSDEGVRSWEVRS